MPIPKDYLELMESLRQRTDDGKVRWTVDGASVDVTLGGERLSLWAGTDEQTEEGFVSFGLKDQKRGGDLLDSWYLDAGDRDYDALNTLYLSAKRHALGIPDRLKKIQEAISKEGVIGDEEF